MTPPESNEQIQVGVHAAAHACAVLRQALVMTSEDTARDAFDRAVTREVARILWLGVAPTMITAFKGAAADVHLALGPGSRRARGRVVATS
jgi:hypothetical protein